MKRIIIFATALLLGVASLSAQESEQRQRVLPEEIPHMNFMNIPIDGSPLPIIEKLRGRGFEYVKQEGNIFILTGTFAGQNNCAVSLTKKENFVWKIAVSFPTQPSWNSVKEMYNKFKNSYIDKYNTRPECTEKLSQRFREGTGQEQWGFEDDSSRWQSVFSLPEGFITLAIKYNRQQSNLYLVVDYVDRVNFLMKEAIDMEDI